MPKTKQHCCPVLYKVSWSQVQQPEDLGGNMRVGVLQGGPAKWHFLQVIDCMHDLAEVCLWQIHLAKLAPPVDGLLL